MYLSAFNQGTSRRWLPPKLMLMMKIMIVIMITALTHVSAKSAAQKLSLNEKNSPIGMLIKKIRLQTGYDFVFDSKINMNLKITVDIKDAELEDALKIILEKHDLDFSINDKIIVIKSKKESILEDLISHIFAIDLKGIVLDEKGMPLPGATVRIKDSDKRTITNSQGEFFLSGIEEKSIMIISYVGYKAKEISATGKELVISLELNDAALEAVNVISTGYQLLSKERATGSFNSIEKDQLSKPSTNIAQRLIGTTAGMQATLDADGNPRFEIRGQTSLNIRDAFGVRNQNASPLVVVDGFPVQGDFNTVNPNDVESITILKDAAAASIWGARSANGVIVVVTKKGKKGTPINVSFSAFTRISQKLDLDYVNPLASSAETVDYEMRSFNNWGATINGGVLANDVGKAQSPASVAMNEYALGFITLAQRDAQLQSFKNLDNRNQIRNELLANPTVQQYNLEISGATQKMANRLSLLYEDTQTNFKRSDNKKYTANYSADADIFKWLQLSFGTLVNYNKANRSGVNYNVNPFGASNPLADIAGIAPYEMLRNADGSLNNISRYYTPILDRFVPRAIFPYSDWTYNPIQEIENRDYTTEQINVRFQGGLNVKIVDGLSFSSKVQYELFNTNNRNFNNDKTFAVRNLINTSASWDIANNRTSLNLPKGGIVDQNRSRSEAYVFRNQLNFNKVIKQHHEVNLVAGSEINRLISETFESPTTYGYNEETLSVGVFPNGPGVAGLPVRDWLGRNITFPYSNKFGYTTDRYFSLFGNVAYTFKDKYTLSGSIRTDASNLITDDPSYRYAPFWSVGFGWQAKKEGFMQNLSWIDRLTFRATYGFNGNVDKSTSFRPLIAIGAIPNLYTGDLTATVSSFGNPTLRWEKTGTWNIGVDYGFFNGGLYGKIDLYHKSGRDLIATLSIPAVNGTTRQNLNNAAMINKGIEIELGTRQRINGNNIIWSGNLNLSYNKNEITKLFVANYTATTLAGGGSGAYVEGENAASIWRYQYAGIKNSQPTVAGPNGQTYDFSASTPGDGRAYMLNMGTEIAPYTLGFINSFKIYDFNLSFILTGKFGHKFQRKGFNYPPQFGSRVLPNSKLSEVLTGNPADIVPLPLNNIEPRYFFWDRFYNSLSYLIEDASHIRMQEINLNYNLPVQLTSKLAMRNVQFFAQGNDLFTVVANKSGEDPEYPLGTLKPQPRITLGIKCEF